MNSFIWTWLDEVEVLGINLRYSPSVVKCRKELHKLLHRLRISKKGIRASRKHF